MKKLGVVTHYFGNINVAVMNLTGSIMIGDMVFFEGYLTDFEQRVDSMQVDKQPISEAKKGMEIAIKVVERVRKGDEMFEVGE
jgi:hypothetical protein